MTKKSALLVLALVSLIGLTIGCKENSSDIEKNSAAGARSAIDSESAHIMIGHWRKTTIVFEKPEDEHLVLDANGAAATWEVTASSRSRKTTGTWSVEGKNLTLRLEGNITISNPFAIHQGQLVFPNIQNQRGFWEKIAQ